MSYLSSNPGNIIPGDPDTAATGQLTLSRRTLRQSLADRFGDLTQLTATSSGANNGTTFIDAINVNSGSEHFNGRQMLITSGDAEGEVMRVTATADATATLTISPAATSRILLDDTADVFNRRGIGFTVAEYDRALNNAIGDAFPLGLIESMETLQYDEPGGLVAAYGIMSRDAYVTLIKLPPWYYEVYAFEWQDADGVWREIAKATRTNGQGWRARPDGYVEITGLPQDNVEENSIRVRGYRRQDILYNDWETCALPKEWLVARAAYHLALGAVMRGQEYGALAQQFQRESEMLRTRLRTVRKANSERVRSY